MLLEDVAQQKAASKEAEARCQTRLGLGSSILKPSLNRLTFSPIHFMLLTKGSISMHQFPLRLAMPPSKVQSPLHGLTSHQGPSQGRTLRGQNIDSAHVR